VHLRSTDIRVLSLPRTILDRPSFKPTWEDEIYDYSRSDTVEMWLKEKTVCFASYLKEQERFSDQKK